MASRRESRVMLLAFSIVCLAVSSYRPLRPKGRLLVHTVPAVAPREQVHTRQNLMRSLLHHKQLRDWKSASAALWTALDTHPEWLEAKHVNVVMATLAAARPTAEWERALLLLDQMPSFGLQPDSYSFSTAINACARAGQTDRALTIFKQCSADSLNPPDAFVFNAALEACRRVAHTPPSVRSRRGHDALFVVVRDASCCISACSGGDDVSGAWCA